jgi:hypothetical protein
MNIVVSSQVQNVGKSSLALLLSFWASKKGKRVLLVDADIGRYTLTELLLGMERLFKGEAGKIVEVEEMGYRFDFGYCDKRRAVALKEEYEYCIVDLDVIRSRYHNEYYFGNAKMIIIPRPSWTINKIKDWFLRFQRDLKEILKDKDVKIIDYPIAVKYDDDLLEMLKWTNYELYKRWKSLGLQGKPDIEIIEGCEAIEYNEEWAKYISLSEYDKKEVKEFIERSIEALDISLKKFGVGEV